jgi:transposase
MRQSHAAGDKLFVDYAGDGVPVVIDRSPASGAPRRFSSRCSAHRASTWTQGLADWIGGHVGAREAA